MRKKIFLIAGTVVFFLLLAGGYGWYLFNKPHMGVEGVTAAARLTAADLFDAFQQNEAKANQQYLGKVLEVQGKVSGSTVTDSSMSLQLDGGALGGINCNMASGTGKQITAPHNGDSVMVKGRCTGYLMDVNLVDCVIEKNER